MSNIFSDKKYHYCYVTTNIITGQQYIGDHSTDNLEDDYLGSGKYLKSSIKKYGKENFKREILKICESKEEAFGLQEKYINDYNTLYPNGYNISPNGGYGVNNSMLSEESKLKISKATKGKKRPNTSLSLSGRKLSDKHKENISKATKGKNISSKHKENISKATKGKTKNPFTTEHRKNISLNSAFRLSEVRDKLSKAKKGKSWEEIYGIEGAKLRRENIKKRKIKQDE